MGSLRLLLLSTACITITTGNCQTKDSVIRQIRATYQRINSDGSLKVIKLENEEFFGENMPDGGGSLTGYYKGDTVCKMTVWVGLSYCVRQYEYYFSKGLPIFIYETEDDFPVNNRTGEMDQRRLQRGFEGRYYLDRGKVVDIKIKGQKRLQENPSVGYVDSLILEGKSYVKLLLAYRKTF
jgi:hypothetical protein